MAKKKKKRRPPQKPSQSTTAAAAETTARPAAAKAAQASARRDRKEEARRRREAALRRYNRQRLIRRVLVVGAAILIAILLVKVVFRSHALKLTEAASSAATKAGCSQIVTLPDLGGGHDPPYAYGDQRPAASGHHSSNPLPETPKVYTYPVPEERAVHNLEHGFVLVYYRAGAPTTPSSAATAPLPAPVVSQLAKVVGSQDHVIMAPYPKLPGGEALALVAWTHELTCPSTVSASQATTIAKSFIDTGRNAAAPEPGSPGGSGIPPSPPAATPEPTPTPTPTG